jgi:hypothetical protein
VCLAPATVVVGANENHSDVELVSFGHRDLEPTDHFRFLLASAQDERQHCDDDEQYADLA